MIAIFFMPNPPFFSKKIKITGIYKQIQNLKIKMAMSVRNYADGGERPECKECAPSSGFGISRSKNLAGAPPVNAKYFSVGDKSSR